MSLQKGNVEASSETVNEVLISALIKTYNGCKAVRVQISLVGNDAIMQFSRCGVERAKLLPVVVIELKRACIRVVALTKSEATQA